MSEMARAFGMLGGNMGCNLIQFPSGKWGFVGNVPARLYFEDGATDKQIEDARNFGERFGPKRRVFDSEQEARDYCAAHGYKLAQ